MAKEKEPITPFISKVRALYDTMKVSSVLVIGGCGDYFEVADTVIMMDCYAPKVGGGGGGGGGGGSSAIYHAILSMPYHRLLRTAGEWWWW